MPEWNENLCASKGNNLNNQYHAKNKINKKKIITNKSSFSNSTACIPSRDFRNLSSQPVEKRKNNHKKQPPSIEEYAP
jgi:hypothetical protein